MGKAAAADELAAEAHHGPAANAAAADVADLVAVDAGEGGARAHAHNDAVVQAGDIPAAQTDGLKFIHLADGDAVKILLQEGGAHARDHDLIDLRELQPLIVQKMAEGPVGGGERIGGPDPVGAKDRPVLQADDLGGAAADVDADDIAHMQKTPYAMT